MGEWLAKLFKVAVRITCRIKSVKYPGILSEGRGEFSGG